MMAEQVRRGRERERAERERLIQTDKKTERKNEIRYIERGMGWMDKERDLWMTETERQR